MTRPKQCIVVVVVALALGRVAAAEDLDKARAHFRAGLAAFTLGDYQKAASEYEAAYADHPDPALLYNAAQAHRLGGDKARALFLYQNYLRYFPTQTNKVEVERHIAALQTAIDSERRVLTTPPIEPKPTTLDKPAPAPLQPLAARPQPSLLAGAAVAPRPATVDVVKTEPRHRSRRWVWGVVGGAALVVAVGLGVGLGVGLHAPGYPTAGAGAGTLQ